MLKKAFLMGIVMGLPFIVSAQNEGNVFDYTKRIHESLEELKTLKPEDYFSNVDNYRIELEKFFDQKKRVCEGEFSTVILSERNSQEKKPVKLKPEERKLCFRELKALQLTFINNLFQARKKYLKFLHEKRIKELETARENAVKSLQRSFDKKRRY